MICSPWIEESMNRCGIRQVVARDVPCLAKTGRAEARICAAREPERLGHRVAVAEARHEMVAEPRHGREVRLPAVALLRARQVSIIAALRAQRRRGGAQQKRKSDRSERLFHSQTPVVALGLVGESPPFQKTL